jgi:hypothetical protein
MARKTPEHKTHACSEMADEVLGVSKVSNRTEIRVLWRGTSGVLRCRTRALTITVTKEGHVKAEAHEANH